MITAILSDIHANLEALERVSGFLAGEGIARIWCLGDIVGYGPDPDTCVARIREMCGPDEGFGDLPVLFGNHDEAALGGDLRFFNPRARAAALWTRAHLSEASREFLEARPYTLASNGLLLSHGSPHQPGEWNYVLSEQEVLDAFASFTESVCFLGHSHVPLVAEDDGSGIWVSGARDLVLEEGHRYLVNVGSVGQPRDRDPRLCFVTFDSDRRSVSYHRLEYDIEGCQRKILEAGLPEILATRLAGGY